MQNLVAAQLHESYAPSSDGEGLQFMPMRDGSISTGTVAPAESVCGIRLCVQETRRGAPRTALEWTGLVRIASGELEVSRAQCDRLVELGLVQIVNGKPCLTQHGRLTLGLPE